MLSQMLGHLHLEDVRVWPNPAVQHSGGLEKVPRTTFPLLLQRDNDNNTFLTGLLKGLYNTCTSKHFIICKAPEQEKLLWTAT